MDTQTREALVDATAALKEAVKHLRAIVEAEEDAADLAIGLQRLAEADADPTRLISGEALEKRLAALR